MHPQNEAERLLAVMADALTPEAAPPAGLKERLLSRIAQESPWKPTPFPGVTRRKLYQDPHTGYVTMLIRMEPGSSVEAHQHSRDEQCYVLEGDVWLDGKAYYAGDFLVSAGGAPIPVASTLGGNLLLVVGTPDHASI